MRTFVNALRSFCAPVSAAWHSWFDNLRSFGAKVEETEEDESPHLAEHWQ